MDSDEDDGPGPSYWRGEQLAVEELAPRLASEDPDVMMFAIGHLLGMVLSFFPAEHREGAGKAVLLHADNTAKRLATEREADEMIAAFKRRDDAQKELDEILTAAKRRLDGESKER
jgi:hypothetical protein